MERPITIWRVSISHTDFVRTIVIASLTLSSILITTIALAKNAGAIYPQLFYFPILYATYFYPKRGIILAGLCGVVYECLVYFSLFPDMLALWGSTGQAILFICVALAVAYFTNLLRVSEARYRSIFENSLLGIILFDKNQFMIRLANHQIAAMLGYSVEEISQRTFSDLFFTHELRRRFFEHLGSGEEIRNFETCFTTKNGEPHWVNLSWSRIDDTIVSCSITDINAEKLARELAADSSTQYQQVTESSPTGMVITDHTKILFANPAFSLFSGYGPEECINRDITDIVTDEDKDRFLKFAHRWNIPSPVPDRSEFRFVTKRGEIRRAVLYFTPIIRNNRPACLVNIVDNTEWEEYRERVEQTRERRREMMRAVAHELRTPLQPVLGYLNLLLQDPQSFGVTEETRQILDRCAKSVDRERQIINQMLELSVLEGEETSLDYSVFSVGGMVNAVIAGGGYALKAEIAIDIPQDLLFEADRQKLSYVIDVLVANGVSYSKPPKKIWITYRGSPSHPFHRLAVQDNGIGITEAQLDAIFKPEEEGSPHPSGQALGGSGLSLAIAKKYVQLHGGYISVDSIVNIGSTFTIHIPKKRPDTVDHHET
ncbi:PAS domain-containing sensor histidine kinase [Methanoregula sp.]|uniref:PAS domain-containing sensor histidine kinase n=1 Tax=Methanoregula sp. TaxID=2052170 RepID=UPI002B653C73|nr:PAS domain-containing sensor histidine kinase [Methanoregula sp.]HVP97320.1 PAS domain-containing sensor histidine kinase [Methanoregula sp.]